LAEPGDVKQQAGGWQDAMLQDSFIWPAFGPGSEGFLSACGRDGIAL